MIEALQALKEEIGHSSFRALIEMIDEDAFFILREDEAFEHGWQASYNALHSQTPTQAIKQEIDQIRELSFKQTFRITQDSELSGYVSDDMELIALASLYPDESQWIKQHITPLYFGKSA